MRMIYLPSNHRVMELNKKKLSLRKMKLWNQLKDHVIMSETGLEILQDNKLAGELIDTVINSREELEKGEEVPINGSRYTVELVNNFKVPQK